MKATSDTNKKTLMIGCGELKSKSDNTTYLDVLPYEGVDWVCDINEGIPMAEDNSFDEIIANSVFEHIAETKTVLQECERVLKPGGKLKVYVPHFSNPYYYSDPTHITFYGLYTFNYLIDVPLFKRKVPNYGIIDGLHLVKARFDFKGNSYVGVRFAKLFRSLANRKVSAMEFWERRLVWLFPVYGMSFEIEKK
ncbi:MAG: class I SAM-dependent methyltransferase [Agarilytica sp.]